MSEYNNFEYTTKQICEEFSRSRDTIRDFMVKGFLKEGRDFVRKTAASVRPTYLWNPKAVQKSLTKAGKLT